MAEKFVKAYGSYRKPVILHKYRDTFEVVVEFNEVGADRASVNARKWNGRSWNVVLRTVCAKSKANDIARKILADNEISHNDFI